MKSLQTIQKTFHVFEILTKIAMIFSFVWAVLAELGLLCGMRFGVCRVFGGIGNPPLQKKLSRRHKIYLS